MALACDAAEIVAMKVPLSSYAFSGLKSDGIVRCKAAPEASPFFKPGDELWDLKGVPGEGRIEKDLPLEWAVWNASSQMLVIKADLIGIHKLHKRLGMDQQPKQCRLKAEVFEVPADGSPLTEKSVSAWVYSWVSKSEQTVEATHQ